MRAYALLRILPLPIAVPAFAIGFASDSGAAIVTGFVLAGLWLVDTALIMPLVLARYNRAERRRTAA